MFKYSIICKTERPGFIDYTAATLSLVAATALGGGTYYANNALSHEVAAVQAAELHDNTTEAVTAKGSKDGRAAV